jgi:hypothetical protein
MVAGVEPSIKGLKTDYSNRYDSTPCVNFTNILWAAFAPKSFCQEFSNPNCKHIKVAQKTFVQKKLLVK